MVESTALERRHTRNAYRGFESLSFRHSQLIKSKLRNEAWIFYYLLIESLWPKGHNPSTQLVLMLMTV